MIPVETILAQIDERLVQISMMCMGDKKKDIEETQYDRGRYAAYREMVNYINTNFSND